MHDEPIPGHPWHDGCANGTEPLVMGYALRTRRWRYIEWVGFEKYGNFDIIFGTTSDAFPSSTPSPRRVVYSTLCL